MDKTRTIGYINESEDDWLDQEVGLASARSMEENLREYCQLIRRLLAMSGIDMYTYKADKSIYYIEDEH